MSCFILQLYFVFLISLLMLDLFCWFLCFYQLQERLWLHILYVEKETCAVDFARGTNFGEEMTAYLFCWFYPWHKPDLHYEKSMIVSWLFVWPIWVWSHTLWNMQWFQFTSQYLVYSYHHTWLNVFKTFSFFGHLK